MGIFWFLGKVMLLILGVWWCREIFGRLKTDIEEVKHPKMRGQAWVVIFYWALTACIMLWMGWFALGIIIPIVEIL